jgi:hypothetical protein
MPDRLTISMYRAGPFLVGAAVVCLAVAWTGHDLSGWPWIVAGLALILVFASAPGGFCDTGRRWTST